MLVEAIDKPMCYRWPEGEVQLMPGQPVDLPESRALRLLKKAPGKVRLVPSKPIFNLRPGDRTTWQGADTTFRSGVVDFLYTDAVGLVWAFVTLPDGGWAAVNTRYVDRNDQ
jgi:hypothetical protein